MIVSIAKIKLIQYGGENKTGHYRTVSFVCFLKYSFSNLEITFLVGFFAHFSVVQLQIEHFEYSTITVYIV